MPKKYDEMTCFCLEKFEISENDLLKLSII